jgi:uncharacterized membrane protein (UPF0182 family)
VLPFNDHTFLYVRPMYVEATGNTGSSFPELQDVIVGNQNGVAFAPTLQGALQNLFGTTQPIAGLPTTTGSTPPTTNPPPSTQPPPSTGTVEKVPTGTTALIEDLLNHEQQAETALKNGDFVTFGQQEALVQSDTQKLRQLLGSGSTSGSPSPSASGSPSPAASSSASPSATASPSPTG